MRNLFFILLLFLSSYSYSQVLRASPSYNRVTAAAPPAFCVANMLTNGDFHDADDWVPGTGWSISGGHAIAVDVDYGDLFSVEGTSTNTETYEIRFTISGYSGSGYVFIQMEGGGTGNGTQRSGNGTYEETLTAEGTGYIYFIGRDDFNGYIDDVCIDEL